MLDPHQFDKPVTVGVSPGKWYNRMGLDFVMSPIPVTRWFEGT